MTDDLAPELLAILHKVAPDVDPAVVDRAAPLVDQLDLDSMDYQNLLARVSERWGVDIPATEVGRLRSIDDLAAFVIAQRR